MIKPLSVLLALLLAVYLVTLFWHPASNIEQLIQQALAANDEVQQVQAAQELSRLGEEGLAGLRKVFTESDNAAVISVSILGLSRQRDYHCMESFIEKLDDPQENVRAAAAKAVVHLLGRDYGFQVRGTLSHRAEFMEKIRDDWEQYRGSELFKFNDQRVSLSR